MMDSQEKTPIEEQTVEQIAVETPVEQNAEVAEVPETPEVLETSENAEAPVEAERKQYQTKKEVLERVREIAHGDEAPQKEEVDYLKTAFYKLHIAEREARLKEYIDGGGDPEQYQITPDELEEAFRKKPINGLSIEHYPRYLCERCLVYCPVGRWKERYSDTGLSSFSPDEAEN